MTNPLNTDYARNTALLLARVPIGVFFLLAGYGKIAGGVGEFVDAASASLPHFISADFGRAYLHALPFVEMLVGVTMIVGFYTRVSAMLMSLMLVSFIIAATGIGFNVGGSPPLSFNVVFLGLTILLMVSGGGQIAVDHTFGKSAPGPGKK
jgi:uncharacterized membrane protein YphA (DoxX/SURF4 family)